MFTVGMGAGTQRPLLLLSPILAETIAQGGLDKATLKQRLFEHGAHARPGSSSATSATGPTSCPAARRSPRSSRPARSRPSSRSRTIPSGMVPIVCRAEDLMIAVSGDPLRTNAYVFAHNGILGLPDHEGDPPPRGVAAPAPRSAGSLDLPDSLWVLVPAGQRASGEWIDDTLRARAEEKGLLARTPLAGQFPRQRVELIRDADPTAEVNRLYLLRGWTDGLPIVPPTLGRVEEMLAQTALDRGTRPSARWSRSAASPPSRSWRPTP